MKHVDAVLDTLGGEVQERSWKVVKPYGILVSIVSQPSVELAESAKARQAFLVLKADGALLSGIARLLESGKIRSTVETIYPLAEALQAQELSMTGHARGKIVLKVDSNC